ncbi:hypothetical protein HRG_014326 [Hirsutella rhossiliensis]
MPSHQSKSQFHSLHHSKLPNVDMQDEITIKEVTEAGVVFAVTTVFLAPYLYWMIRVKPREASLTMLCVDIIEVLLFQPV